MALRLILQRNKPKIIPNSFLGLWGSSINKNSWNPSSSISCSLHNIGDFSKSPDGKTMCAGTTIYQGAKEDQWIISLAQFAVTKHNENQNGRLQFVRVVGASHTAMSNFLYHITLEANDARKRKIFHAVVWLQMWKNLMELLVWRSVHDSLSTVGIKRGDLKLHEAVMLSMSQTKEDFPRI